MLFRSGDKIGQKVNLDIFQEAFIISVYDNPNGTDTAILSIGRKNAKTGTISFIVILHTVGPEAKQNSQIVSGANARKQAAQVYKLASKCIALSPKLRDIAKCTHSSKSIIGLPMNVEYEALSAEAGTAHGLSPVVAILDEVGQVVGPRSDFIDAITTAQGAYSDPLLIYISTQAANDADLFSTVIDDALKRKPKGTVCHVYTTDIDADLKDESKWIHSNPAIGSFRCIKDMRKQADKAVAMPSAESTYRNLNLNQRVSAVSPFVSRSVWEQNSGEPEPEKATAWFGGLDLSARTDLTAFILAGIHADGEITVLSYFWTPADGLAQRSKRDRAPYDMWVQQGLIRATPGKTVDYEYVAREIVEIIEELPGVNSIAFDRWRIDVLKKEFERIGAEPPLVEFGQSYKDMAPALDELEAALLNGRLRHGGNPVMQMCAANAVVVKDPAGGRKLDKSKATGRIDGMVALAMAMGASVKSASEFNIDHFLDNPLVF